MTATTHISFDLSPAILLASVLTMVVVLSLASLAARRSRYDRAVVGLEIIRVIIAALAVVTVCQPEWVETYEPTERPVLAVLRDVSASMDTRDIVDDNQPQGEPVSRMSWMNQQLDDVAWDLLERKVDVVREDFASSTLDDKRRAATDINAALAGARERHSNLRAAILLSDGDWNEGGPPTNVATQFRINRIPVYTVAFGSEESLPDIEVVSVEPPTFSVVGKSLQIPFSLRSTLATDHEADVQLTAGTGAPFSKRVVIPAMGQVSELFFWTPDEVGDVDLTVSVSPHPLERLRENNRASVSVAIKSESLRVLLVESTPRWEYRYLRNALQRDPGVDVSCLLFHPGLSKRGGGAGYLREFPQTDEALAEYDVVFLGDVGAEQGQLSGKDCQRIRGLVEQLASGLVLMPGMRGHQFSLLQTPLKDLYPVVLDATARRGFGSQVASSLVLTQLGETSLLTKLADTARENSLVWRSLPGFQWRSPAIRARAGCEVLAIHEQSRAPLLVTKTFGTGKILFAGTDSAWRWREGVEDKYHYRFWGQVARWMAYQRHMAEGEMLRVFYTPDRPTAGTVVELNATVLDPAGAPLSGAKVTGDLVNPRGQQQKLAFQGSGSDWGLYTARFSPQHVGRHRLTLRCQETSAVLETAIEVQGGARELVGKPARHGVLHEIAQLTRGDVIPQHEMGRLCDLVLQLPPPDPLIRRRQIWASPYWAGTLIGLLGLFWMGRKMVGAI